MIWVGLFTLVQLADLATGAMVAVELNPLAAMLNEQPLAAFAVKVALIALVTSVVAITYRIGKYRKVGHLVLTVGILAGLLGTWSNL